MVSAGGKSSGVFIFSLQSESETTARHTARVDKSSFGILQKFFNHSFGFAAVANFRINHVVAGIVGAKNAPIAEGLGINRGGGVTLAFLFVNEDRSNFRIRMTGRNGGEWEKNDALA